MNFATTSEYDIKILYVLNSLKNVAKVDIPPKDLVKILREHPEIIHFLETLLRTLKRPHVRSKL